MSTDPLHRKVAIVGVQPGDIDVAEIYDSLGHGRWRMPNSPCVTALAVYWPRPARSFWGAHNMAEKPIPKLYQDTAPYWEAARNHQLLIQKCLECGRYQFYPRGVCQTCLSSSLSWFQAAGSGSVYSFTVNYRAPHPGFVDDLPFITAIVELKEGVRMMTNLVQCDPEQAAIGMPVRVVFDPVTEDVTLPKFRPA